MRGHDVTHAPDAASSWAAGARRTSRNRSLEESLRAVAVQEPGRGAVAGFFGKVREFPPVDNQGECQILRVWLNLPRSKRWELREGKSSVSS